MVFCVEYFVECEMQFYAVCIWGGGLNDRGVARQEGEFGNSTAVWGYACSLVISSIAVFED
jgi:hypothetical protein